MGAKINDVARAIKDEGVTTKKGTLRRYRHAISDTVNHRVLRPYSPQAKVRNLLVGKPGYSAAEQKNRFEQVIEITSAARDGNVKAQSCRAIAKRALKVIEAREEEKAARKASLGTHGNPVTSWDDDHEDA